MARSSTASSPESPLDLRAESSAGGSGPAGPGSQVLAGLTGWWHRRYSPADSAPYRIDVRLDSLDGLYSVLDPSPFRQRDLDPRAVEHIVQWASDAPPKAPLELRVSVPGDAAPEATEADTQAAIRNYFLYEVDLLSRRHRRNRMRTFRWLSLGLGLMAILLTLHSLVGRRYPDSLFNDIVGEAFVIAGWVALWVPIERLGFDGWLLKEQLRLYQRLAVMRVEVVPEPMLDGVEET
jgi:hypothetical protein